MRALSLGILTALLLSFSGRLPAQVPGFRISDGSRMVEFPFERYNNLILIPVTINGSIVLKFILDSGVQNCIITEPLIASMINIDYERTLVLAAPGREDSIKAHVTKKVTIGLPGIVGQGISLVVLDHDYLHLSEQLGTEVYGIIGYELFSRFVIDINHDKEMIRCYEPRSFKPKRSYNNLPLIVRGTKPYTTAELVQQNGERMNVALMVDSGASHALLLDPHTSPNIFVPESHLKASLGKGLGGEIEGVMARLTQLKLGNYSFSNVITSYPAQGAYGLMTLETEKRNGTLGGEILSRFNLVFDYFNQTLYLRKNSMHKKKFEYDMSGMELSTYDTRLTEILVDNVRENSPAARAGIKKGDVIRSVNGLTLANAHLTHIVALLRHKKGRRITLKVLRSGVEEKVWFRLERMI